MCLMSAVEEAFRQSPYIDQTKGAWILDFLFTTVMS